MKKCINCQEELYDQAVICPKCQTPQPDVEINNGVTEVTALTKSKKRKKKDILKEKFKSKKVKKIIKISAISVASILVIYIGLSIGYQFLWSNYINTNMPVWTNTVATNTLTTDDFTRLSNKIRKYGVDGYSKYSFLNPFGLNKLGINLCDNYKGYENFNKCVDFILPQIQFCYEEYYMWKYNETHEINDVATDAMSLLMSDDLEKYENEAYFTKYKEMYDEMKPSEDNVKIDVNIADEEITVHNKNAFPIYKVNANLSFTLFYVLTYSGARTVQDTVPISAEGKVDGGKSKDFPLGFGMNDYSPYYSYLVCEVQSKSVKITSVSYNPFDEYNSDSNDVYPEENEDGYSEDYVDAY